MAENGRRVAMLGDGNSGFIFATPGSGSGREVEEGRVAMLDGGLSGFVFESPHSRSGQKASGNRGKEPVKLKAGSMEPEDVIDCTGCPKQFHIRQAVPAGNYFVCPHCETKNYAPACCDWITTSSSFTLRDFSAELFLSAQRTDPEFICPPPHLMIQS